MRTDYIDKAELGHLLAALTVPNRLALEVSLATGLRIGDVLQLRTEDIRTANDGRISLREQKTGKRRRLRLPNELLARLLSIAGRLYVFEHRLDWRKNRTRQAVFKDLRRSARLFRVSGTISPHSTRKVWAVEEMRKHGDLKRIQKLLNHADEAVTVLYALADELTKRKRGKSKNPPQGI